MIPRPVTVEDEEDVEELQSFGLPVRRKPNATQAYSRASSESSGTVRGDSVDNSPIVENPRNFSDICGVEPKRQRLGPSSMTSRSTPYAFDQHKLSALSSMNDRSRSTPYAFDQSKLSALSSMNHQRENIGNDQSRKRACSPASMDPPHMQYNGESSKSSNTTSHHRKQRPRNVEFDAEKYAQQHPEAPIERGRVLVDIDAWGDKQEEEFFAEAVPSRPIASPRRSVPLRNSPIALPCVKIESVRHGNSTLKAGKTVELQNGQFLFIIDVIKNLESDAVKLRGWQLKRCSDMDGLLRRGLNELCFIYEVELDDPRSAHEQSMIEMELGHVVKVRELIRTNYPFPYLRFSDPIRVSDDKAENKQFLRDNERLVVRWKYTTKYANRSERLRVLKYPINIVQKRLESLTEQECTEGYHLDPLVSRSLWREETIPGGSGLKEAHVRDQSGASRRTSTKAKNSDLACPWCDEVFDPQDVEVMFKHCQNVHLPQEKTSRNGGHHQGSGANITSHFGHSKPLSGARDTSTIRNSKSRYLHDNLPKLASDPKRSSSGSEQIFTFGDAFCGGGGTTRGAVMAGLSVIWGLDKDSNSGKTWRSNFPSAKHYEMWANEFIALDGPLKHIMTDILHLSPPCQVWSPVHTRPGQDDEQNFTSLFACEEILKKARPRIVTLEQTFGILHPKFSHAFNALIQTFTFYGYSISWQLVQLQRWGLPQRRHRLIILAAGPGETLPEVPRYTHAEYPGQGLKPLKSVNSALSIIPRNAPHHDVAGMLAKRTVKTPWDGSGIASCITCNGGEKGHPSGLRNFTIAELAVLQTFPLCHQFHGNAIRKQIGNAVPPLIAKILYRGIIKHLEKTDDVVHEVEDLDIE